MPCESKAAPLPPHFIDGQELARRDELAEQLHGLIRLRWAGLALLCVALTVVQAFGFHRWAAGWRPCWAILAGMAALNLAIGRLHDIAGRSLRALNTEAMLHLSLDLLGLALLMYLTGYDHSPFVYALVLPIVAAAALLDAKLAFGIVLLAIILFVGLAVDPSSQFYPLARATAFAGVAFACFRIVNGIARGLRRRRAEAAQRLGTLAARSEELEAAVRKLASERDRALAILEGLDCAVVAVDLSGKVLFANAAGMRETVPVLEIVYARAGILLEGEGQADLPAQAPPAPAACLTDALHQGGKLDAAALALLGGDPPKAARPQRLQVPAAAQAVGFERGACVYEASVRALGSDGNGLLVIAREVSEPHWARKDAQ